MTEIDVLVGAYGLTPDAESQIAGFLEGLHDRCSMDGVNVFCVERACRPIAQPLRDTVSKLGFHLRTCPLPPFDNSREDTSQFTDWMMDNVGSAPWVIVSHFDVVFHGDYVGYVRSVVHQADMVGNHHDGIMAVSRDAYRQCQVGFCGVDCFRLSKAGRDWKIMPFGAPHATLKWNILSLDVGELLALRMATLLMRHKWMVDSEGVVGRSDLFTHTRGGSGHDRRRT